MSRAYITIATYPAEQVLACVPDQENGLPEIQMIGEHRVNMGSVRYKVFKYKGTSCVICGITGTLMALEYHKKGARQQPHFNLYAKKPNGESVMMTRDHIIPISKGGAKYDLENLQCMCEKCNHAKGSQLVSNEVLQRRRESGIQKPKTLIEMPQTPSPSVIGVQVEEATVGSYLR